MKNGTIQVITKEESLFPDEATKLRTGGRKPETFTVRGIYLFHPLIWCIYMNLIIKPYAVLWLLLATNHYAHYYEPLASHKPTMLHFT